MTEDEVVGELESGMTIGIGGWGSRRKPMSLVRAILRSDLTDLQCGIALQSSDSKIYYGSV